ncbi:hypothetical protein BU24DRAFT_382310 [Aaosphaeria arxii CBS 175.79]|uniref:DUF336-domain-containing protein n=1 Tax=Aaosphaeria arxii CBS 175.79 TaxID=1450172 RepID=A0A6A5Y565_9PLEO|nr:uncharacterized protein BU24DRAFT_382310 [Aaosphaeria arxii CBS 175.79]KAF2020419.1 hypothetical protein BU24DRAFT_382310 [Aaosphaeria arxii CBS 175.79]
MTPKAGLRRRAWTDGHGLQKVLAAKQEVRQAPKPIAHPPKDVPLVKETCDSFTFESFTEEDAWELGHLLYARLLEFTPQQSTVISIALASSGQILFQTACGPDTTKENENWIERKRNTILRFAGSSWYWHCVWDGDEDRFRKVFSMSIEESSKYAIHGGGVPIRVRGVAGIVAVVCVSGLQQEEDHGVIVEVINDNWH